MNSDGNNKILYILIITWLLTRIPCFTLVQPQWTDVPIYERYASNILNGQTPYYDFDVEYPPLAIIIFLIPGMIAKAFGNYHFFYRLTMLFFDFGCLVLVGSVARAVMGDSINRIRQIRGFYIALTAIAFQFLYDRFDIAVSFMILLVLYLALVQKRWFWAYVILWLATLTKIFPIILFPLLFMFQNKPGKSWNKSINDFGYSIVVFILIIAAFIFWSGEWWQDIFAYHGQRGIQIESLYSSIVLVLHTFGVSAHVVRDYGAFEIQNGFSDILARTALIILGLSIIAVYIFFWRKIKYQVDRIASESWLVKSLFAAILFFVLFNKVLSPQFLLWLFPFAAIIYISQSRYIVTYVWILAALLTAILFPYNYVSLLNLQTSGVWLLITRNLILAILSFIAVRDLFISTRQK